MSLLLLTLGCYPHYASTSYLAELEVSQTNLPPEAAVESNVLNKDLHKVLGRKELTVAFYPPSSCLANAAVAGSQGLISTECGLLMSALEERAALNGYGVVSWQFLRGQNMQKAAVDAGVDLIFELDHLSVSTVEDAQVEVSGVRFLEKEAGKSSKPIEVGDVAEVGQRCVDMYGVALSEQLRVEPSVALSLKAVDPKSGRALWYLRYSGGGSSAEVASMSESYTFQPARVWDTRYSGQTAVIAMGSVSGILMMVGGAAGGAYKLSDGSGGAGLIAVAVLGTTVLVGSMMALPGTENYPMEPPDDVICVPEYATRPVGTAVSAEPVSSSGSSWGQTQTSAGSQQSTEKVQVELTQRAADAVFAELSKLNGTWE